MSNYNYNLKNSPRYVPELQLGTSALTVGNINPKIILNSNITFKDVLNESRLNIDWGDTGLSFSKCEVSGTKATITCKGIAKAGEIKISANPEAFNSPYDLAKTLERTVRVIEYLPQLFEVEPSNPNSAIGNKKVKELQTNVEIKDHAITGTLNYVEGLQLNNKSYTGNFLAVHFDIIETRNTDEAQISYAITNGDETIGTLGGVEEDVILIVLLPNMINDKYQLVVRQTNPGYTKPSFEEYFDLSQIKLEKGPAKSEDFFTIKSAKGEVLSKNVDDIQKNVRAIQDYSMTVSLEGTLYYIDTWPQFGKDTGNFVALEITPTPGVSKVVMKNKKGEEVALDDDHLLVVNIINDNDFFLIATDEDGEHEVAVEVTNLICEPKPEKLFEVSLPSATTSIGNKEASELNGDVQIVDSSITGTVSYVTNLHVNDEDYSGNYLAIKLHRESNDLDLVNFEITKTNDGLEYIELDDLELILIKCDKDMEGAQLKVTQTRTSTGKKDFEEIYDLSELQLAPDPATLVKVSIFDEGLIFNHDASEFGEFSIDGTTITGVAKRVESMTSPWVEEKQGGYYLPILCDPWEGTSVRENRSNEWTGWTELESNGKVLFFLGKEYITAQEFETKNKDGIIDRYTLIIYAEDVPPIIELTEPKKETYYGKKPSELQTDIVIGDNEISGILHKVKHYDEAFSGELSEGFFLALDYTIEPIDSMLTVELTGRYSQGPKLATDGFIVCRITDPEGQTLKLVGDNKGKETEKIYDLSKIILADYTVDTLDQDEISNIEIGDNKYIEDIVENDYSVDFDDETKTAKISGTIKICKDPGIFDDNIKHRILSYVPVKMSGFENQIVKTTGTLVDQQKTFGDLEYGMYDNSDLGSLLLVNPVYTDTNKFECKAYVNEDAATNDENGVEITIDLNNCTFKEDDLPKFTSIDVDSLNSIFGGDVTFDQLLEDFSIKTEGNCIIGSGTIHQTSKDEKYKYFVPFIFNGANLKYIAIPSTDSGPSAVSQIDSDEFHKVLQFDSESKLSNITLYANQEDANSKTDGRTYWIDLSKCNFIPMEPVSLTISTSSYGGHEIEEFGQFEIDESTIKGSAYFISGMIEGFEEGKQEGYYISLDCEPGEEAQYRTKTEDGWGEWASCSNNKIILWLGKDSIDITNLQVKSPNGTISNYKFEISIKPIIKVTVPRKDEEFYTYQAQELQDNIVIDGTNISGTLKYIKGFKEFPDNERDGNFLVLNIESDGNVKTQVIGGNHGEISLGEDTYCVYRIKDTTQTIKITSEKQGQITEVIYNLEGLKLIELPKITSVKIADQDQSWKGVKYSDLMSADTDAQLDDKTIRITGTLFKYDGNELLTSKGKNLAVVGITVNESDVVVKSTKLDGSEFTFEFTDKTSDDFVVSFDEDHKTREFTFYIDQAYASRNESGIVYTIDASEATLETRTKEQFDEDNRPAPILNVSAPDGSKTFTGGKRADEMQSNITINDDSITGTLKYLDYPEFSTNETSQTGHYLVLELSSEEGASIQTELQGGNTIMKGLVDVTDGWCIYHVTSNDQKVRVVATRGKKTTEKIYSLNELILDTKDPVVKVTVPEGSKTFSGKRADEIQTNINVTDTEITGTLNYFKDFKEAFPANESLQHGNYLVLEFNADPSDGTKIEVELQGGETIMKSPVTVDDGWCIFHVTSNEQKLHVIGTNGSKKYDKVYSLENLVLGPELAEITSVKVAGQGQSWKGVTYSDLMSPETQANLDGNKINITGTLYRYDGWSAFGEDLQNKNYLVLNIEVNKQGIATKATKINGKQTLYTFSNKTSEDFVIALDEDHKTYEITYYPNGEYRTKNEFGVVYTIDLTNCKFETRTKEDIDKNPTHDVNDKQGFLDAITQEPGEDGKIHIEVTQPIELDSVIKIEKPIDIDLQDNKLSSPKGIQVLSDMNISNGSIDNTSSVAFIIGNDSASPTVELDGVNIKFDPTKAHSSLGMNQLIRLQSSSMQQPNVTLKDCTIEADPVNDIELQIVGFSSMDNTTGGGNLILDGTTISTTSDSTDVSMITVAAPGANVSITNGSKIQGKETGIVLMHDSTVEIDNSEVSGTDAILFATDLNGIIKAHDTNVTIKNGAKINSKNNRGSGVNNAAAVIFNGGDNNTVTVDETSSVTLTGGSTSSNNEYLVAFYKGNSNTIDFKGTVTASNNKNKFLAIHQAEDGDGLYFDKNSKKDTIKFSDDSAKKFYLIIDSQKFINIAEDVDTAITVAKKAQNGDPEHQITIRRGSEASPSGKPQLPEGITLEGQEE